MRSSKKITPIKALSLLLIFFIPFQNAIAEFYFKNINADQGLSSNSINAVFRDHQGYVWIGTNMGLNRYDGNNTQIFKEDPSKSNSLNDNYITSIRQDADGLLWIITKDGANKFDYYKESVSSDCSQVLAQRNIQSEHLYNVVCGKKFTAHFIDKNEIVIYNHTNHKSIKVQKDKPNTVYTCAFFDHNNYLWALDKTCTLYKINSQTGKIEARNQHLSHLKGTYNNSLFIDKRNNIWITINARRLFLFNTTNAQLIDFQSTLKQAPFNAFPIRSVIEDNNNTIWIATDHGGIFLLNPFNFNFNCIKEDEKNPYSISENSITSLFPDQDGAIWVGTFKQGVNYFHPLNRRFKTNKIPGATTNNDINCFVEDKDGNIYIGTNGNGLFKYNTKTNSYSSINYNNNININRTIVSLFFDSRNRLWIGTYMDGLYCYENGKFIHYLNNNQGPINLPDENVWSIIEDSNHEIWIGTLNVGLFKFDENLKRFTQFEFDKTKYTTIECSYKDKANNLLFGTTWGIMKITPQGKLNKYFEFHKNKDRFAERNYINSIAQDKNGYYWIATQSGLAVVDNAMKNYHFIAETGIENKTINMVLVDKKNSIWISTNTGIYKIQISNYNQLENIKLNTLRLTKDDGLQDNKFNGKSAFQTKSGLLLFGGTKGFNIINPHLIQADKTNRNIVLTKLYINNNVIEIGDKIGGRILLEKALSHSRKITLKHNENTISISFSALNFLHPEKFNFEYQLKGFDDKWITIDASNPKASYNNLGRGTYTFNVRIKNPDTQDSAQTTSLIIEVEPPFWLSWPAYFIYLCIIVSIIVFIYRYLIEKATFELQISKELQQRKHIEEISAMKVKFFTNLSHELRTPVSLILLPVENMLSKEQDPVTRNNLTMVLRNAKRILFIVNQLLDFRKLEVGEITYHPMMGNIVAFIKDVTMPFMDIAQNKNIKLTVKSNVEELFTNFDHNKLERIVFNLLSNAFKYTANKGSIDIIITYDETKPLPICIEVNDTGIGIEKDKISSIFQPFYQADNQGSVANMGTGIGLSITNEFVKLHKGTIHVESQINKGTSFIIQLPMTENESYVPVLKEELPEEELLISNESLKIPTLENISKKNKTILIVDDNDDFRFYLVENLRTLYNIIEAIDGQIAYEKANRFLPDIIVSDVNMPVSNGFELCERLKSEVNTSHIPIILLTANTLDEDKITGFEAGADEYISKPFNVGVLKARIRNLLIKKEEQRNILSSQSPVEITDINLPTLDEKLLEKVNKYANENISNPEFSIEELSKQIGMSSVYLNKKISALTGKTTSEYVRSIRLRKAAILLEKTDKSISEIAYEVGYNSPKYFSKYFKDEYKILPSEYRKNFM